MEILGTLEEKIVQLIGRTHKLTQENSELVRDKIALEKEIQTLRNSENGEQEAMQVLLREKKQAHVIVDTLINKIDSLVEGS